MTDKEQIRKTAEGCITCFHYFGLFKYPLSSEQLYLFNPARTKPDHVDEALRELTEKREIYQTGGYFMKERQSDWVGERLSGEERAGKLLKRSGTFVNIIASFPFVRGIAISGSLSKFYASEDPDIDYFIITDPNRLWIARSLLHLFKKLTFITGHEHYFCMNYFIDTHALTIEHPNLYSAIELKTLLPVYNKGLLMYFAAENTWADQYLPNHPGTRNYEYLTKKRARPVKYMAELILNLLAPRYLNRQLMKLTDLKWRRKWRRAGYNMAEYDRAFRTGIHISKNHPVDYQKKVMDSLPEEIKTGTPS